MYNQLTPEIIEEIKKVSNNVFLGEEINPDYAKDEMPIYGTHMPDLAVQPRSTEEVAAVMKICYENNIPVTPRGAGSCLAGGWLRCSGRCCAALHRSTASGLCLPWSPWGCGSCRRLRSGCRSRWSRSRGRS